MKKRVSFRHQAGLTLVELMVASTLSIVLLAGVLVLFSGNKASYRLQQGLSSIQDSGRYAISQIKRDIEIAGYGGCITESLADSNPQIIASSPLTYVTEYRDGIRITGDNNVDGTSFTVDGEAVADQTDTLQIRGPLTGELFYVSGPVFPNNNVTVMGDAGTLAAGDYVQLTDCSGAEIFEVGASGVTVSTGASTTSAIPNDKVFSRKFSSDSVLTSLVTRTYFVGTSAGTNRAGNAVSALFVSDGVNAQEVLQGVEDMQITYAIDENGNGVVDNYEDAAAVTDWTEVLGVRISLLVNSIEESVQDEASYVYLPDGSNAIAPPTGDFLLRQEFAIVATLRNNVE